MENKEEIKGCNLSNEDLIVKCNEWVTSLCKTGGKSWSLSVPVNFNRDPDMLFSELAKRLNEAQQKQAEFIKLIEEAELSLKKLLSFAPDKTELGGSAWDSEFGIAILKAEETLTKLTKYKETIK